MVFQMMSPELNSAPSDQAQVTDWLGLTQPQWSPVIGCKLVTSSRWSRYQRQGFNTDSVSLNIIISSVKFTEKYPIINRVYMEKQIHQQLKSDFVLRYLTPSNRNHMISRIEFSYLKLPPCKRK